MTKKLLTLTFIVILMGALAISASANITVYFYDTYGEIAENPQIMWGDKGWGGWEKFDMTKEADGWYSYSLETDGPDLEEDFNMIIFNNGRDDSDELCVQWVWYHGRMEADEYYFIADKVNNELNANENNYQGIQYDCSQFPSKDAANNALKALGIDIGGGAPAGGDTGPAPDGGTPPPPGGGEAPADDAGTPEEIADDAGAPEGGGEVAVNNDGGGDDKGNPKSGDSLLFPIILVALAGAAVLTVRKVRAR